MKQNGPQAISEKAITQKCEDKFTELSFEVTPRFELSN